MPYVTARGQKFHYERQGSGDPLLLIPGALGAGQKDFHHQIDGLSTDFTVIAPDPRGYGKSRPPMRDFPEDFLERDAHDMVALMSGLGYSSFFAGGWSDGGNSALLLALHYPEMVARLVVWGANSYLSARDMECLSSVRSLSDWSERARQAAEAEYGEQLPAMWIAYFEAMDRLLASGGEICRKRLSEIQCPVLVIHGDRDTLVPAFHAEIIANSVKNGRLLRFGDGRHNVHMKYFREFNEAVQGFLRQA